MQRLSDASICHGLPTGPHRVGHWKARKDTSFVFANGYAASGAASQAGRRGFESHRPLSYLVEAKTLTPYHATTLFCVGQKWVRRVVRFVFCSDLTRPG